MIRIVHTAAFRIAAFASVAFLIVGGVAMGVLYWRVLAVLDNQVDKILRRETADITAAYAASGLEGLRRMVSERASSHPETLRLYLVIGSDGSRTGNLQHWPSNAPLPGEIKDVEALYGGYNGFARARTLAFADGSRLLMERLLTERTDFKKIMGKAVLSAALANLLVGLAAGIITARYSLLRLGRINKAAHEVLKGDLTRRIDVGEGDDEYDTLARSINAMLDRIERLVATIRGVTENIAHDLRTPLNHLRGRLEVALMSPRSPEEYQAVIQRGIVQADGIVSTFNAMLKIARVRAGAASPQRHPVDLCEVVEELSDLYQALAEEDGASVLVRVAGDVTVMGDAHLISQATANLLDNAIKYSPPGGTVELSVFREKGVVRLSVADKGPGVPPEQYRLMVEPFKRLDQSAERQGSGLGLSFVSAVAEWHGAGLEFADNSPGLRVTLSFVDDRG